MSPTEYVKAHPQHRTLPSMLAEPVVKRLLARVKGALIYPPDPGGPIVTYSVAYRWRTVRFPDRIARLKVVCWWQGW